MQYLNELGIMYRHIQADDLLEPREHLTKYRVSHHGKAYVDHRYIAILGHNQSAYPLINHWNSPIGPWKYYLEYPY